MCRQCQIYLGNQPGTKQNDSVIDSNASQTPANDNCHIPPVVFSLQTKTSFTRLLEIAVFQAEIVQTVNPMERPQSDKNPESNIQNCQPRMGHNVIHNKLRHRKFCNITGNHQCMCHRYDDEQIQHHNDISLIDNSQRRLKSLPDQCQQRHFLLSERRMDAANDTADIKHRKKCHTKYNQY